MPRRTRITNESGLEADHPPASVVPINPSADYVRELIAIRAYELFSSRPSSQGDEVADWLAAESEVMSLLQSNALCPQPLTPRPKNGARRTGAKTSAPSRIGKAAERPTRNSKPKTEAV